MLKMIIVDDERVIREAISQMINWEELGIELIGLCSNGLEAYDMIIDEFPDIVLTDIKMPGMNGLELVKKISETDLDTQFIILSGYGEFDYAKEAMKYGIRHYVLKPCTDEQIAECIQEVSRDCQEQKRARNLQNSQYLLTNNMHHNIISSIISESVGQETRTYEEIISTYEPYMDFHGTAYHLFFVYYLEIEDLKSFLQQLQKFWNNYAPQVTLHGVYVNNTLLIFFKNFQADYKDFADYIRNQSFKVPLEVQDETYNNLHSLLSVILDKLKRFSTIYYINNFNVIYTCNYNYFISETERLYDEMSQRNPDTLKTLADLLSGIDNINFLKQLSSSLLLKASASDVSLSTIQLTEWLLEVEKGTDLEHLKNRILERLDQLLKNTSQDTIFSTMTRQIFDYVENNLESSNLTLKYISENHLYMNVDYVSKKFLKETGQKFSDYLIEVKLRKAKKLMAEGEKVQDIAEKVGCGNNPQYFSQLFKRETGMTPSFYITNYCGRS